jgi:8-oxo-dGTP pyrophosphatase MutT (NUDIX family)
VAVFDLPRTCYQRATALVTDPVGRLLVFDHVGDPAPGTQVPAGGIKAHEEPAAAVLRELAEESGLETAQLVRKLGEAWYVAEVGNVPAGLEEQVHHAYHLHLDEPPSEETWEWDECSDGGVPLHRFAFRWVTLESAAQVLWPIQALWIASLRCSLAHLAGER